MRIPALDKLTPVISVAQAAMRISVPTAGVFAEAVLGGCNSCEVKDDTRSWRFEESPCDEQAPTIAPVSMEPPRANQPDLRSAGLPTPVVNIQNAPALPDPTSLAAALQTIGNPTLFRDVTGLTETQRSALQAYQSALQAAQAFGSQAATLEAARQRQAARREDMQAMLQQIRQARQSGAITADQEREYTTALLRSASGATEVVVQGDLEAIERSHSAGSIDDQPRKFTFGWSVGKAGG
ncbi:MAG TPA: hypothetical protein VFG86_16915 [Chloroflexota bacterium]|nr:hypothetical protein [Chloroflexota bacterium]